MCTVLRWQGPIEPACRWVWLCMMGRLGKQRRALQALEGRLSDTEAAQFRWWAWAQRKSSQAAARVSALLELVLLQCSCTIWLAIA